MIAQEIESAPDRIFILHSPDDAVISATLAPIQI
jgi:hypothetical protein